MRRHLFTSLAVAGAVFAAKPVEAQCSVGFSQVFYSATFGCYRMTTSNGTWTGAQANATTLGGYLAAISSAAENTAIRTFANSQGFTGSVWIGFTDQAVEGTFVWVNGEPVVYTNWGGGEPNNLGNEDFTELLSSGSWNDLGPTGGRHGVVEQAVTAVPEPATGLLIAGGLAALGVVARRRRG